jgi:hypothetical protein
MTQPLPSLSAFERHVATRETEPAVTEALRILRIVDENMGGLNGIDFGIPFPELAVRDLHTRFATRFVAAFGDLLTQPNVSINATAVELLFIYHRWTDMMFALSGFQSSAHLVSRLTATPTSEWKLSGSALVQFLVFFSPSSTLEIDLDECYAANPGATVIAALGYLSARCCVTERACAFREHHPRPHPPVVRGRSLHALQLRRGPRQAPDQGRPDRPDAQGLPGGRRARDG